MFGLTSQSFSFIRFDDGSVAAARTVASFNIYSVEEVNNASQFCLTVVLPLNASSLAISGMYKRSNEKHTFRSITLGFYVSVRRVSFFLRLLFSLLLLFFFFLQLGNNSSSEEMPTHVFSSPPGQQITKPTPTRSIEFRNCKFESCEMSVKSATAVTTNTAAQTPTPFSFGAAPAPTNPWQPSNMANTIVLRFSSSTALFSDLVTCKEWRLNSELYSNPRPALPVFPGTTLVRSLNHNLQFAINWNWFDLRYSNKNYWLYERKDRLIFRTILLIRKFRSTALTFIDMNVIKIIFDLIAVPMPLMLTAVEHVKALELGRKNFCDVEEEINRAPEGARPDPYLLPTVGATFVPKVMAFERPTFS
jgi:hypothetical protein